MTAKEIDKIVCDWSMNYKIPLTQVGLNALVDTLATVCLQSPVAKPQRFTSPYDYVQYDDASAHSQAEAKQLFNDIEHFLSYSFSRHHPFRPVEFARQHLEEAYAWIGKAIRDDQAKRADAPLREQRTDS